MDYGIWYPKHDDFRFVAYTNLDWAGCLDERKSTSAAAFFLGNRLVCWHSKKQESTKFSTVETEYIAACSCCQQVLWMVQTLSDMKVIVSKLVPIYCDNQSAINISKNLVMHSHTKHIDVRYHFIREHVLNGNVEIEFVPSSDQLVDIFTKPLSRATFEGLRTRLGVLSLSSLA